MTPMVRLLFVGGLVLLIVGLALAIVTPPVTAIGYNLPVCSAAVHAKYQATGPDGTKYPTWHPQIDQGANCHFDHEHGSNPSNVGPTAWNFTSGVFPAYGYTSTKHGMTEGHNGFKSFTFRLSGHWWLITNHFGTASPPTAACERFHTLDIVAIDDAGTVKVDLHLMADFGKATSQNHVPLTPTACSNQAQVGASTGARLLPVQTENGVAYEPWRTDSREVPALGLRTGGTLFPYTTLFRSRKSVV